MISRDWVAPAASSWVRRLGVVKNSNPLDSGVVVETTKGAQCLYINVPADLWRGICEQVRSGSSAGKLVNEQLKGRFQERSLVDGTVSFEEPIPLDLVAAGLVTTNVRGWPFS